MTEAGTQRASNSAGLTELFKTVQQALLVEDSPPFPQRKYSELVIDRFRMEAESATPQRARLEEYAGTLGRYAPAAAKELSALIPVVMELAAQRKA